MSNEVKGVGYDMWFFCSSLGEFVGFVISIYIYVSSNKFAYDDIML